MVGNRCRIAMDLAGRSASRRSRHWISSTVRAAGPVGWWLPCWWRWCHHATVSKTPRRWLKARPPSVLPCVPRQPWPGLVCALLSRRLHEPITLASLGGRQALVRSTFLARVRLGELDGACRAANEAGGLLRQRDSQHLWTRLGEFRKSVQPYAATAQVKDFDATFGDLIRTASP